MGELLSEASQQELGIHFLIVSHYLYETLRHGNRGMLADIVQQHATKLGYNADALEKLKAKIQQAYLRDRGKRLLRAVSKAIDVATDS